MIDNSIVKTQMASQRSQDKGRGRASTSTSRVSSSSSRAPPPPSHSHYGHDLGYGQLGSAQHQAAATASHVNTLIQHSIASAYAGAVAAAPVYGAPVYGAPVAHPGYPGFSPL